MRERDTLCRLFLAQVVQQGELRASERASEVAAVTRLNERTPFVVPSVPSSSESLLSRRSDR